MGNISSSISVTAIGTSPIFSITAEEFLLRYYTKVTPVSGDFVPPPVFGVDGGFSQAMSFVNQWFPWIDEKLVPPKYDGVCEFLGIASNRPTYIKDYHMIALNRAVDYLLAPTYIGIIQVSSSTPAPQGPPTG